MFTKPPDHDHPEFLLIKERMAKMEARIEKIEGFQRECDDLHKKLEEQNKRYSDSMKYNTESNIFLTKSVNDLNITITQTFTDLNNSISKLTDRVDSHDPVVKGIQDRDNAIKYNKNFLMSAGAIAASITAIMGAVVYILNYLMK